MFTPFSYAYPSHPPYPKAKYFKKFQTHLRIQPGSLSQERPRDEPERVAHAELVRQEFGLVTADVGAG